MRYEDINWNNVESAVATKHGLQLTYWNANFAGKPKPGGNLGSFGYLLQGYAIDGPTTVLSPAFYGALQHWVATNTSPAGSYALAGTEEDGTVGQGRGSA